MIVGGCVAAIRLLNEGSKLRRNAAAAAAWRLERLFPDAPDERTVPRSDGSVDWSLWEFELSSETGLGSAS